MDSTKFNKVGKKVAAIATIGLTATTGLTLTGCATNYQAQEQLYRINNQMYNLSNFMWNLQDFFNSLNQFSYSLNAMSYEKKQKLEVYGKDNGKNTFLFSVQRISKNIYLIKDTNKKTFLFDKSNENLEKFLVFHKIIIPKPATVIEANNTSKMLRTDIG